MYSARSYVLNPAGYLRRIGSRAVDILCRITLLNTLLVMDSNVIPRGVFSSVSASVAIAFLRGMGAGHMHSPPPFTSWTWDQATAEFIRQVHCGKSKLLTNIVYSYAFNRSVQIL